MTDTRSINSTIIALCIALGVFAAVTCNTKPPAVEPTAEKYIPLSAPPAVPTPIDRGLTNRMPDR